MEELELIGVALLALFVGVVGTLAFQWSDRSLHGPALGGTGSEDDVAAVLAAQPATSVLLDADSRVLRASPDAYPLGLVRGDRLSPVALELIERARGDGGTVATEIALARAQGPELVFDARATPLSRSRVLLLAQDRTAAKRLEEVRRDFVANVSHELKTPVGALSLLAETVHDAAGDPEAVRRFTARMTIEARRLADLVQEIIVLSRVQAPDVSLAVEDVELDQVIAEAVDRVAVDAREQGTEITIGGVSGLHVRGDRSLLTMAVRNLLDNALRYSPPAAPISVVTKAAHGSRATGGNPVGTVSIAVIDQGAGIHSADVARIFERFFRGDPARSRDTGGTGLGLSIVKHVAANHGGDVRVWSKVGRGSTFTLRLPESAVDPAPNTRGER
ncbi:cell wall metabolism sensor histidine kinase WalK [Pseudactinotalea sp. HY158]|uniref:sensor histidine kinase n=1 Tax=unclassified Pseudactinotalea TaxID=2649176 RepID=UPI001E2AD411|nr:ATP-binding protein [Pseudactinotalea sp. HY158]